MIRTSFLPSLVSLLLGMLGTQLQAQIAVRFEQDAWEVSANKYEFIQHKGKSSLYLEGGTANLKGAAFKNGIIDFDVLFAEGRKFIGIHFRVQDESTYEEYYLRAHQSGNPDAMQYTPVFHGNSAWQLYHGKGYSTPYRFNFGEWTHVRLIIDNDRMDVFLNDMSQPILHVPELKMDPQSGGIGFRTLFGGAYYANLTYQEMNQPKLLSARVEPPATPAGTIQTWQVSSTGFASQELEGVNDLEGCTGISASKLAKPACGGVWSDQSFTGHGAFSQKQYSLCQGHHPV